MVENRNAVRDRSVDWHDIAAANEQPVSRPNVIKRHFRQTSVDREHRGPRHPRQEGRQVPGGAAFCKAFKVLATGVHQGYDDGRQSLAENKRACHGESGDNIEAHFTAP